MRNFSRRFSGLAPDSPDSEEAVDSHAWRCVEEVARRPLDPSPRCFRRAAMPSSPARPAETLSTANAAPDDAWNVTSTITPLQDRHFSLVEEEPVPAHLEPSRSSEPEPVVQDNEFSVSDPEPDEPEVSVSEASESDSFCSRWTSSFRPTWLLGSKPRRKNGSVI